MAAVSNATTIAALTEVINSELIPSAYAVAVNTPYLASVLAREIPLSGAGTRTLAYPIFPKVAAASALTETDEVDSVQVTPSETTISATLVEQSTFLSRQSMGASVVDSVGLCTNRVLDAIWEKRDDDLVGLSASMTNSIGDNATTNDISNYNAVMTAFRAQAKAPGMVGMVLHPDAARDLNASAISSGAPFFGGQLGQSLNQATMGANQGFRQVTMDGITVFISDRVPTADTSGWGNFVFELGESNPLGYVPAQDGAPRVEAEWWQTRQGWWFTATADYGVGILDQARCLEFISKT